jgi:hypothetical protein
MKLLIMKNLSSLLLFHYPNILQHPNIVLQHAVPLKL